MTGFEAIDALLAAAKEEVPLPSVEERRALREQLNLSRAQVAQVLGVSPSTVGGWESGRDPGGEVREKYAYFLEGARTKLAERAGEPVEAVTDATPDGAVEEGADVSAADSGAEDVESLPAPRPCVLCGGPARHQVAGFPQHLDPTDCGTAPAARPSHAAEPRQAAADPAAPGHPAGGAAVPEPPVARGVAPGQPGKPAAQTEETRRPTRGDRPRRLAQQVPVRPVGRRVQTAVSGSPDLIGQAVAAALARHDGDVDAATAALVKRAIPDAMALLDETRKGGRYDIVAHPWIPDVLRKQSARGADQIWEARPKWFRAHLPPGVHEVTALDINGAYLSALKTHLPIGRLEHSTGFGHDRRRAGVHLITPPVWEHEDVLPNPIGNRDEPGPLWVTEPTLRLLLRLSGPTYGLCDPPEIHESFTSGATEGLLEKFRVALKDARDGAIAAGDEVTLEYVKAMYSKFVSTMGESNYNRELYRPDWMHLIRSQAFANLWMKAYKAHAEGLTVVRAMGTDELHVSGDWRTVFPEGRGVSEVKVKDVYTVGSGAESDGP